MIDDPDEVHLYRRIDPNKRQKLVELTEARANLGKAQAQYSKFKMIALQDPSEHNLEQLSAYSSLKLDRHRKDVLRLQSELMEGAVDIEKLKDILPTVFLALSQAIDIPMLLNTLDLDERTISEALSFTKKFFKNGFDGL